jgi:hypothetical protein
VSWLGLAGALVATTAFVFSRLDAMRRPASMIFPIVASYRHSDPDGESHTTVRIENGSDMPVFECGLALFD